MSKDAIGRSHSPGRKEEAAAFLLVLQKKTKSLNKCPAVQRVILSLDKVTLFADRHHKRVPRWHSDATAPQLIFTDSCSSDTSVFQVGARKM